jgi:hypothetical protein
MIPARTGFHISRMILLPKKGRSVLLMPCAHGQNPFEAPEGFFSRAELKHIGVQPARIWIGAAEALGGGLFWSGRRLLLLSLARHASLNH